MKVKDVCEIAQRRSCKLWKYCSDILSGDDDLPPCASKIMEENFNSAQQTNGAGAEATLPPDCLECAFGSCCDRPGPVADGSCFEQRR